MASQLLLVGGFLGAGKTTLLRRAAAILRRRGRSVAAVTNDQAANLVDTALARHDSLPVAEIAGGCFCCRFPDLLSSLRELQASSAPDVILAEPVGSCTDLAATVLRPLETFYPDEWQVAPLTVLVDPEWTGAAFPGTVDYLHGKQLAEAEIILLNKNDLLAPADIDQALERLQRAYPQAKLMAVSARTGAGIETWLDAMLDGAGSHAQPLDLDYRLYAEAEAALGWLNATGTIDGQAVSPQAWITACLDSLSSTYAACGMAVAHLKLFVQSDGGELKGSITNNDGRISWDLHAPAAESERAHFILNARVNAGPGDLETATRTTLGAVCDAQGIRLQLDTLESFSPLPPRPTFRLAVDCSALPTVEGPTSKVYCP